jgi:hypothetical protein
VNAFDGVFGRLAHVDEDDRALGEPACHVLGVKILNHHLLILALCLAVFGFGMHTGVGPQ